MIKQDGILLQISGNFYKEFPTPAYFCASMSNKNKKKSISAPAAQPPAPAAQGPVLPPLHERLEQWLGRHARWVLLALVALWIGVRVPVFFSVAHTPLRVMYLWDDSDNRFFDDWAKKLAAGDWLNRETIHPYHTWHREFADYYFQQHPDKKEQILAAHPDRDSTFVPGKVLWDEWYGGPTYHQEPLYPYVLAILYKLTGDGPYWMLALQCLLGVLSGVLMWLLASKYMGNTSALLAGLLYAGAGIAIFQEVVLLRTAWITFFTLLNAWLFDRALTRQTNGAWLLAGVAFGFSYLIQSTFSLFLLGVLGIYGVLSMRRLPVFARHAGLALGGFLLVFGPVMLRNRMVGAPLTSLSSVGAITFIAANVKDANTINSWYPEKEKCAEIMGRTDGKFGAAAREALKTHTGFGSYWSIFSKKLYHLFSNYEYSSNENYYFYRLNVPMLPYLPVSFYWIGVLGLTGIAMAAYARKTPWTIYVAILLQLAILLGFYVCGRFRIPLALLLLPFAGYTLMLLLRIWPDWKNGLIALALLSIIGYGINFKYYNKDITMLRSVDYRVLYDKYYLHQMDQYGNALDWAGASEVHLAFMRYEPEFTKRLRATQGLTYNTDVALTSYIARHYEIQADLYQAIQKMDDERRCRQRAVELRQIVQNSKSTQRNYQMAQ